MALASRSSAVSSTPAAAAGTRSLVVSRSRLAHGQHGHGNHHVAWYEKQKELWTELDSGAAIAAAASSLPAGKMLVVDYYASWCAVCKTAYPGLCRIASDKAQQQHFVFAKASLDEPEVKEWVKQEGIRGIPHLSVYDSTGAKVLGMGASFKKCQVIVTNLQLIAKHKDVVKQQQMLLPLDPNSYVMIPGVEAAVTA